MESRRSDRLARSSRRSTSEKAREIVLLVFQLVAEHYNAEWARIRRRWEFIPLWHLRALVCTIPGLFEFSLDLPALKLFRRRFELFEFRLTPTQRRLQDRLARRRTE
jgi:hypothetical protein